MNTKPFGRFAPSGAVALFFLALTLIGLLLAGGYGLPCDEPAEQAILRENMNEYAVRLFGESSKAARYYDGLGVGRISQSIERDHGECAYYSFVPLLTQLSNRPDALSAAWQGYTWLLFMLGVFALYALLRALDLSRIISCLGAALYALCPRFFAEGHYNNKDIALLTLVLLTLWLGARFLQRPGFARGLWFSFAGAMATNTKIVGAFPWALVGAGAIVLLSVRREWSRRMGCVAVVTVAGYAAFYALLTPAMWTGVGEYFAYLLQNATGFTRWTGVVIFRGERYEPAVAALPHSYLPYLMWATLPLYLPPLCAVGQASALHAALRKGARLDARTVTLLALTLLWLVPTAFVVLRQPVMYNGWRHFYFVFAGLAPMAALGLRAIWQWAKKRGRAWRLMAVGLLCAAMGVNIAGLIVNHPYQYGYYQPLARADAGTQMELDYWDVSTVNAMKQLTTCQRNNALALRLGARDDMSWFGVTHGYDVLPTDMRAKLSVAYEPDAPYLFYNTTYALIYGIDAPEGYHSLFAVESYGNALCTVYERD